MGHKENQMLHNFEETEVHKKVKVIQHEISITKKDVIEALNYILKNKPGASGVIIPENAIMAMYCRDCCNCSEEKYNALYFNYETDIPKGE